MMNFNEFLLEKESTIQQKAIQVLDNELDWQPHNIHVPTEDEIKMYKKPNMNLTNSLIYQGMAGSSLIKDIKQALASHNIQSSVYRGFDTGRKDDNHDYIIILR